jgi:DNA-binding response OmpR family regulator
MDRIVCFSDDASLASAIRQGIAEAGYELCVLPASRLSNELRDKVRKLSPKLILMKLTPAFDNAHLFFFLRSDNATRETPLILVSDSARHEQQAAILGADGFLLEPFVTEQLPGTLASHLFREYALAA